MESALTIPVARVLMATGGKLQRGNAAGFSCAVIDGRAAVAGALFFAVRGDRFDGHDFVAQAIAQGATGLVIARGRTADICTSAKISDRVTIIEVDDTILALGKLARAHREAMTQLRVVGVTGSNGKTTCKEMIASILSTAVGNSAVLKTEGNLNNHLGVPLTLLRLTAAHRYAVIEMGMSALGEIAYLTKLANPDVALIVNIAGAHLESLGTLENVAKAKAEIFQGLGPSGVAVVPFDEPLLDPYRPPSARTFAVAGATVMFHDIRTTATGTRFELEIGRETVPVDLPLIGRHNVKNAAAAAAATMGFVSPAEIARGLGLVRPAKHRLEVIDVGGRVILDDCYNASPLSMRAALDALKEFGGPRKRVAVLGDMLELGPDSAALHSEVGAYAGEIVDALVTVGERAHAIYDAAARTLRFHAANFDEAAHKVTDWTGPGDVVLVKASRGMQLERVIDALRKGIG